MPPTLQILVATLTVAVAVGCDTALPPEVPTEAARGLAPAAIDVARPMAPAAAPDVAAWVNGTPIARADLELHLRRALAQGGPAPAEVRRRQVLDRLIDERLVAQWLERGAVEISQEEVDARVDASVRDVFGTREALTRHLEARGRSLADHRAALRLQIAEERILAPSAEDLTDAALQKLYREIANRPATATVLLLSSIHLGPDLGPDRAAELATAVRSEADFAALPGRRAKLGWVDRTALGGSLAQRLLAVAPPGPSGLVQAPGGYELYWVHDRAERPTPHFLEVRERLEARARSMARSNARARLIRNLRSSAKIEVVEAAFSERTALHVQTPTASPSADSGLDRDR